ncbi:MAG: PEP/pyruvate-binding domain-containing protein [Candidatus Nanohaloarchaea archaeon]|nr:PEP/pyruvate-binding domain-containing protein [Candidatus Nanohaloarchaea archaeon]
MPIQWLDDAGEEREVGRKASSLAAADDAGLDVPRGFVVTAPTFEEFVQENGLERRIQRILDGADRADPGSVRDAADRIRSLIEAEDVSDAVREEIEEAYEKINMSEEVRSAGEEAVDLVGGQRETEFVAVRSSPTGARIPGAHHTALNVNGKDAVMDAIKECWASLYAAEALSMEEHVGDIHSMAVIVQRMVEPDVSGAAYSSEPVGGEDAVVESVWGLGTALSGGATVPDRYRLGEHGDVREEDIATKGWKIVRDPTSGKNLKQRVAGNKRSSRTLDRGDLGNVMEAVRTAGSVVDGDVKLSFAIGRNGVHVLDVERVTAARGEAGAGDGVVTGSGAAPGRATGEVSIVYSDTDIGSVGQDDILAAVTPEERLAPVLDRAAAVVADQGGLSTNLAALARALDMPCVVGTGSATDMLTAGETVTVDGAAGTVSEGRGEEPPAQAPAETTAAEAAAATPDLLTATRVKVLNSVAPGAEGAVIPDYLNPRRAEQVADEYQPEQVWVRTDDREGLRDNLGVLAERPGDGGTGIVLGSYGNVMRAGELLDEGAEFLGIDVPALEQDGGREALLNAVEKIGEEGRDAETAVLLAETDPECIETAVESGIDTVAVPEGEVERARRAVARAERGFMLDRLRDHR